VPRVGRLDLADVELGDGAGAVRHAVQARIMERHERAVAREMDVGLEIAEAQPHRGLEGRERVLGRRLRPTAVGKRDGPVSIQKRVRHRLQA
jgi:hypothetical protein